jgi:hypothetical protein
VELKRFSAVGIEDIILHSGVRYRCKLHLKFENYLNEHFAVITPSTKFVFDYHVTASSQLEQAKFQYFDNLPSCELSELISTISSSSSSSPSLSINSRLICGDIPSPDLIYNIANHHHITMVTFKPSDSYLTCEHSSTRRQVDLSTCLTNCATLLTHNVPCLLLLQDMHLLAPALSSETDERLNSLADDDAGDEISNKRFGFKTWTRVSVSSQSASL